MRTKYFRTVRSMIYSALFHAIDYEKSFIDAYVGGLLPEESLIKEDKETVEESRAKIRDWEEYMKTHYKG